MCRKKRRRPSWGLLQKGAPSILLQSNPKRSFISSSLVTEHEIYFVNADPGQIFDGRVAQSGGVRLGKERKRFGSFVFGRISRQEREECLVDEVGVTRNGSQRFQLRRRCDLDPVRHE